jgi:hypothetical protein
MFHPNRLQLAPGRGLGGTGLCSGLGEHGSV